MSIVNFKNNPFNNSDYSDAEKNGDVESINPLVDGEPRTAEILNRPSNFDWGRTEILKESVEALWAELLVRKFSVEAIARLWTGYYYNNNGTPTFVPGKILIPANTSLKIVGYALPQWGVIPGSNNIELYQNPVIGICFNKSDKSFVTIRFRRAPGDNSLEEYNPTSNGLKCGHEIILKLILGPSNQQSNAVLSNSIINDKYAIFEISLKNGASISPNDIANAFPDDSYFAKVVGEGTSTLPASLLAGHIIKSGETIKSYDDIPDNDTSLQFYNRAPVSKYEIDIPASTLKSFFDLSNNLMYPGDILFVRFPQRPEIPRDGSILREIQNRQYIGKHLVTDINDLIIYTKRNNYNVQKLSPTNHLLIPIVRINAPYADNYNQITGSNEEILRNKLFYAEFIDGVKVYPGKWHYDINEEDEGQPALITPAISINLTTQHKQDFTITNFGGFKDGLQFGYSYIRDIDENYYYENKDYLLIRGTSNNVATIIKINSDLENNKSASIWLVKNISVDTDNKITEVYSVKVKSPATIEAGGYVTPHYNDSASLFNALAMFEEHRRVGTDYGHKPNTVAGNAIKDHEITPVKISNDAQAEWSFPGKSFDAHTEVSELFPNPTHIFGNFYNDSIANAENALKRFSVALGGNIVLGSKTASTPPVPAGLSIIFTAGTGVTTPGYVVYYNSTSGEIEPVKSTNFKDTIGILLKAGTYCHILIYGICYCRKTTGYGNSISKGKKIIISETNGYVMAKPDSGVTYSLGMALETASQDDQYVKVLFWGYRSEP
jgi:hypothetical protein